MSMIIIIGFSVSLCVNCVEKKSSGTRQNQSVNSRGGQSKSEASKQAMKDGHLQAR